jgi:hypothetical protein
MPTPWAETLSAWRARRVAGLLRGIGERPAGRYFAEAAALSERNVAGTTFAAAVCWSKWFDLLAKQLRNQARGSLQTFFGEDYRFGLPARVGDVALFMQAIHGIPVESFPRAGALV